jgi:hypothetical protein
MQEGLKGLTAPTKYESQQGYEKGLILSRKLPRIF